jgi:hypothetical protein
MTEATITRKPPVRKPSAKEVATSAIKKASDGTATERPKILPIPKFSAPEDFKPAFYIIRFAADAAGLIDPASWNVSRLQGKLDNPKAKIQDISEFDTITSLGLISRLSARLFQTNMEKRLTITPEGREFIVTIRASKNKDGFLISSVKLIQYVGRNGKIRTIEDKTDPTYRRIKSVSRFLPSSFVAAEQPPRARVSRSKVKEDDTEEE